MRPADFSLPNIRKLFIPDPGKIIFDADLTGADAAVAAKECGGAYFEAIKAGRKINVEILEYCYPEVFLRWKNAPPELKDTVREPAYTKCKNMHYGSIYVGSPRGISQAAAIPLPIVQRMQPWFFNLFPEVKGWHTRVQEQLYQTRGVKNAFGYRVVYFDRLDGLLPEAVNWICQSTVAIVCQRGSLLIRREFPEIDLLLQVHDSLVGQVDIRKAPEVLPRLRSRLNSIPVPYQPDPLTIPWGMKASRKSWGDCQDIDWSNPERIAA
jgi:hypothetical protein